MIVSSRERWAAALTGSAARHRSPQAQSGITLTSTLIGAAIKDGHLKSLDDAVTAYLPEMQGSAYDGVTIRQLLTMTSGAKWNEDYTDPKSDVAVSSNWVGERGIEPLVSYMRRLPREAPPGSRWSYKTGETDLAGILLARAVHQPLSIYLSDKIWRPMGMENDAVWMLDRGGLERGGCCLGMTLRDSGRLALFIEGGAKVHGHSILPEGWLAAATVNQVNPPGPVPYGYFWWPGTSTARACSTASAPSSPWPRIRRSASCSCPPA